jgi:hypothetical protein
MIFSTKENNVDAMEGLQQKAVGEQQHRALDKRRGNAMANSTASSQYYDATTRKDERSPSNLS